MDARTQVEHRCTRRAVPECGTCLLHGAGGLVLEQFLRLDPEVPGDTRCRAVVLRWLRARIEAPAE